MTPENQFQLWQSDSGQGTPQARVCSVPVSRFIQLILTGDSKNR